MPLTAYTTLESVQRNKLDLSSTFTDDMGMRAGVSLSEMFTICIVLKSFLSLINKYL